MAKWDCTTQGADLTLSSICRQVRKTPPSETSDASAIQLSASPINFNLGTPLGSYGQGRGDAGERPRCRG